MSPLARDIVVVLMVKVMVLFVLWYAFFSASAAPGMKMATAVVEQQLVTPIPQPEPETRK